ncbi:MAG: cytochrome c-type biogenesis protein CcmH [Gammaproteobacteria bacterium]|nr:cytochrome c-type biogenesis protein CcmH [Gammaproteobacteria bacterium]NIR97309.1 cytochrome c-type biogenesis protein CcmH [Gammaproteobacteria bacterium]NIT63352.1 cytochrome c-type biogenesis protein CcmH [Gammaproteobacteria bacterium]NIV20279.1 cytochrome c-type biogenesis protein CcmH [Gammaproteobacteria bacterium]NIX10696.1 cytochrome c-type biogenesis protein CcmH [Gammaproteobacteria bacterium]
MQGPAVKRGARSVLMALLLACSAGAFAGIEVFPFDDPAKEERFNRLTDELRCLVCQNQSLADSNAELAQDLRHEVYDMIQSGASDDEIVDFMVARYGDFVLYRPPVRPTTYALWAGPFLLLALAVWLLARALRRQRDGPVEPLSEQDRARARSLLQDSERGEGL